MGIIGFELSAYDVFKNYGDSRLAAYDYLRNNYPDVYKNIDDYAVTIIQDILSMQYVVKVRRIRNEHKEEK